MVGQGIDPARYTVVPRTLVLARRGDEVLLMRRPPDSAVYPGLYNGLGGHVEAGEDLVASAQREVAEESGLHLADLTLAGLIHLSDSEAETGVLLTVFTADVDGEAAGDKPLASPSDGAPAKTPSPEGEVAWVSVAQLEDLNLVHDLPEILTRLWPDQPGPPFVAYASASKEESLVFST
jgi:8-oxo-dGTP diphosphatase